VNVCGEGCDVSDILNVFFAVEDCLIKMGNAPTLRNVEIKKGGTSYTAETLEKLKGLYPADTLCFVVGGDSLQGMETWYHPERIFAMADIIAVARDDVDREKLLECREYYKKKYDARIEIIDVAPVDVSSSQIRDLIAEGKGVGDLVAPAVMEYIEKNGIFK
jgi:nicotinate-nucleotide adenylyltransferase